VGFDKTAILIGVGFYSGVFQRAIQEERKLNMANLQITKLGIIKGGVCEKIFKQRSKRETGADRAWQWLLDNKCIRFCNGWYQIIKLPPKILDLKYVISQTHDGDIEIGWRRFISDVAEQLFDSKRKFRLKWMRRWVEDIASFEFGIGTTDGSVPNPHDLEIIDMLEGKSKHCFGYASSHQDEIYKKWIKQGD